MVATMATTGVEAERAGVSRGLRDLRVEGRP
jgi:hypothetical protein